MSGSRGLSCRLLSVVFYDVVLSISEVQKHPFNFPASAESETFTHDAGHPQDVAQAKKIKKTPHGCSTDVFLTVPGVLAKVSITSVPDSLQPTSGITIQNWTDSPEGVSIRGLMASVHLSDVPEGDQSHGCAGVWWACFAPDHHVSSRQMTEGSQLK